MAIPYVPFQPQRIQFDGDMGMSSIANALMQQRQATNDRLNYQQRQNALLQQQQMDERRLGLDERRINADIAARTQATDLDRLRFGLDDRRTTANIAQSEAATQATRERLRLEQEQAARGQVVQAGPGHQFYHISPGSPGEPPRTTPLAAVPPNASTQLTAGDRDAVRDADTASSASREVQSTLGRALQLNPQVIDGYFAAQRGQLQRHEPTIEFGNLVTQTVLGQLRSAFGASPTEGERQILLDVAGSANQPRGVRQRILERALAAAQSRETESRSRAEALRRGTYYQPGYGQQPAQGAPAGAQPPQQGGQTIPEGTVIRNGQGQRMILRNGQWQPL
jgi:hypothetical protein